MSRPTIATLIKFVLHDSRAEKTGAWLTRFKTWRDPTRGGQAPKFVRKFRDQIEADYPCR